MKAPEALSLKGRALRLLSAREHSRAELLRKLRSHAEDEQQLLDTLDELTQKGFLSEERVVESIVHQRSGRLGTQRVVQELQRKGLPSELIEAAQCDLRASEVQRSWAVWQRKYGQAPVDAAEKLRQMRFLASRGFSQDAIRRVMELARDGLSPSENTPN
jgi:regulatory protein